MNYLRMKRRIATNIDKENSPEIITLISDFINEVREEIAEHPLSFLNTTKSIPLVAATYSYKIDASTTTSRYSGLLLNIRYDNGVASIPVKLDFCTADIFDSRYPTQEAGEPTAYTVRGDSFIVNRIPSTVTSKVFITNYFMLPDKLSGDSDESYIDKRYYRYIIARTCERIYLEYLKEGRDSSEWSAYWISEARKQKSRLILNESYFINPQSVINTGGL